MTRPQIIRADTLDLQDHDTPSAKDHTRQPEQPAPLGGGRPAPHQEQSIRHADQDSKSEIMGGAGSDNPQYRDGRDAYEDPEQAEGDGARNSQYEGEDSDLADGESDDLLDDDLMDKISSSPSIDDEDIDFEFVYALHNFVATVDGQANAAKGDTMVLLDDSNSYWWLVRVVKDGSIGYLPAEHIETPTERLARLNKHRNVDLSATMLGDNSEKSKNPLKKAMRRRNAKTVNFSAPTYIEASDVDFSTDDDSEHGDFFNDDETETVESEEGDGQEQAEDIVVEPLRPKGQKDNKPVEQADGPNAQEKQEAERASTEPRRSSDEFFDADEPAVSRSRNGTVRNTDSFFKDDTAEPKKISLTPNLLRDESGNAVVGDPKDGQNQGQGQGQERGSFENIEKIAASQDKVKEEKKRKDKKPGMLSGLFKRKDKKSKTTDDDAEEIISPTESSFRASPQPKTSMESLSQTLSQESRSSNKPQRDTSKKLQKQPPAPMSPVTSESTKDSEASQSIRQVSAQETHSLDEHRGPVTSPVSQQNSAKEARDPRDPFASPVQVHRPSSEAQWRGPQDAPDRAPAGQKSVASPPQKFAPTLVTGREQGSESPADVSPVEGLGMTSVPRAHSVSPLSPPSSPEADVPDLKGSQATPGSFDTLSVDTPTWSDASLRSYLDDENDIRDLFIIVHDKSNIPPAGPEHPVTGRLFKEESKRLKEMNNQLDEMLVGWMSQRNRHSNSMRGVKSPTA